MVCWRARYPWCAGGGARAIENRNWFAVIGSNLRTDAVRVANPMLSRRVPGIDFQLSS